MPSRRRSGYLDRLVDQVPGRRGRGMAWPPRQLAWGPTRPAGGWLDDETPPSVPVLQPPRARGFTTNPSQRQRILAVTDAAPAVRSPTSRPPYAPVRTTTRQIVREPVALPEPRPARALPPVVHEVERVRETIRHAVLDPHERQAAPVSPVAPPVRPPSLPQLPAAVARAMERLGALSLPVPPPAAPATVATPAPTRPASPLDRNAERGPAMTALVAPRPVRDEQPTRAPQVHIGSIEVIVAAPPAPPAAPPLPGPRPAAPPPVATGRLSRPADRFGFGQG